MLKRKPLFLLVGFLSALHLNMEETYVNKYNQICSAYVILKVLAAYENSVQVTL